MRITKTAVIQAAANLADEGGLSSVSLKAVAEKLEIRTPSLYNHIENLEELLRTVAHEGMREMNERMTMAALGKSGDAAIRAVGAAYLDYVIEHPGIYETIQWASWHETEETEEIFGKYTTLLKTLLLSSNIKQKHVDEALNLLTGILHGYTTLQLKYAFAKPDKVRNHLCDALDTALCGIHKRYDKS